MKHFVKRLLFLGTDKLVMRLVYAVSVTNMLALFGAILSSCYLFFQMTLFGEQRTYFITFQVLMACSYLSTLLWNLSGRQDIAKIWICLTFLIDMGISSTLIYGNGSSIEWLLLMVFPISYLIWEEHQSLHRGVTFALTIGLFYFVSRWDGPSLLSLSDAQQSSMAFSSFLSTSILLALASFSFVSETKRARAKLEKMANFDALTGILNRREFEVRAEAELSSQNEAHSCALFLIDLDEFKKINDQFGHAAGDAALKHVVAKILSVAPEYSILGRLGGDEFCLFLPSAEPSESKLLASRILEATNKDFSYDNRTISVSVSIGLTTENQRRDLQRLLSSADNAMYEAKRMGRAQFKSAD